MEAQMPRQWQLQEAKARFSQLVERALAGEVQVVTRRGRPAVVVIPYEEYERMQAGTTSAWDIFKTAPRLDDEDLPLVRDKTPVRPLELA
jgi:prevent-host-death family protein